MRKTHYRDYATEAFRFLARERSAEAYRNKIWNEAIERQNQAEERVMAGLSCGPTEGALMAAERAVDEVKAELADLEAAEWAAFTLGVVKGSEAIEALRIVYMTAPDLELAPGDIHDRTVAASQKLHVGEATIYRWLGFARKLFAKKRGLRCDN